MTADQGATREVATSGPTGKVDDATKERIRAAHDLVEMIGQTVELKKVGSSYKGNCP